MHHVAPAEHDSTEMLEETAQRGVGVERKGVRQRLLDSGTRSKKLVLRNDNDAQAEDEDDSDPRAPASERALLVNSHKGPKFQRERTPDLYREHCASDSDHHKLRVVSENIHGVEPKLWADVVIGDVGDQRRGGERR